MGTAIHIENCGSVKITNTRVRGWPVGANFVDCGSVDLQEGMFINVETAVRARGVKQFRASDITHEAGIGRLAMSPLALAVWRISHGHV